jgi:hypothetical protein
LNASAGATVLRRTAALAGDTHALEAAAFRLGRDVDAAFE